MNRAGTPRSLLDPTPPEGQQLVPVDDGLELTGSFGSQQGFSKFAVIGFKD